MSLRFRRSLALLVPALLLPLSACGDDASDSAKGFDAVEITGAAGAAPEVKWNSTMEPGKKQSEVLIDGTGAALKKNDRVMVNFMLSNGFTRRTEIDSYGAEDAGASIQVGAQAQPQQAVDLVTGIIAEEIKPGTKIGTRGAITVGAEQAFGEYVHKLGDLKVGNEDGLLIVYDVVGKPLTEPKGKAQQAPEWAPQLIEKKGVPTALTFDGLAKPKPKDDVRVATLIKGTGEKVESGDVLVANYLGQVHGSTKPFDASYTRGEPLSVAIGKDVGGGATPVVEGWTKGLEGVPVGSRVIVQIPPRLGYGKKGNSQAGISGTDTMYFLIDVLGAA